MNKSCFKCVLNYTFVLEYFLREFMSQICLSFGNKVKESRNERGLTQEELASNIGIERAQLSKIESGSVDPRLSTAIKLIKSLNIDTNEFINSTNNNIHPFVKRAGGKTQLLDKIIELMPKDYNDYYEPFVGGGALFFKVKPRKPHINDVNSELMAAFACFKSKKKFEELKTLLMDYEAQHSEEKYLYIRSLDRSPDWTKASDPQKAARMIYLNKACFNGLYRVNSNGFFNVPSGKKERVHAYDELNYLGIYEYFKESKPEVSSKDFVNAVSKAKENDFVYFDPPYDSIGDKNGFVNYAKEGFTKDDQVRLADCFKQLSSRGVKVMLSNHNTKFINELYKGFNIHVVKARRNINSKGDGRGEVEEVIITNY